MFLTLLLLFGFNGIRVGAQLVISAWLAVKLTGNGHAVGILFVCGSASALVLARPLGSIVNAARSKKRLVVMGHAAMAIVQVSPLVLSHITHWHRFTMLVIVCALTTTLAQLSAGATDYFVRRLSTAAHFQRRVATLTSVAQMSMMVGTAGAGVLLQFANFGALFATLAALSCLCGLIGAWRLDDIAPLDKQNELRSFSTGRSTRRLPRPEALRDRYLLKLTIASMALAFAVGQITNVLLPGLVQLHRNGSSVDYAAVEIAWSVGSVMAGGALAIYRRTTFDARSSDSVVVAILAALTMLLMTVPFASNWPALIAVHLLLGIGYATVRVINDARFLTLCAEEHLGHTRATANIAMQIAALAAFSLPIVANPLSLPTLYLCAAGAIGVATAAIGWNTLRLDKSTE